MSPSPAVTACSRFALVLSLTPHSCCQNLPALSLQSGHSLGIMLCRKVESSLHLHPTLHVCTEKMPCKRHADQVTMADSPDPMAMSIYSPFARTINSVCTICTSKRPLYVCSVGLWQTWAIVKLDLQGAFSWPGTLLCAHDRSASTTGYSSEAPLLFCGFQKGI